MTYTRYVSYGIGRRGLRSRPVERRSKRSFRRWTRRRNRAHDQVLRSDVTPEERGEG